MRQKHGLAEALAYFEGKLYGGLRRRKNQPGSETCLVECQNGAPRLITRQNDKEQDCIGGICIFFRHVVIESDTLI